MAVGLLEEYRRPVLVPMTLVQPEHGTEIFAALDRAGVPVHHFYLQVPRAVLERRIDGRSLTPDDPDRDAGIREWCKAQIEPCLSGVPRLPEGTILLDGERPVQELAGEVLARVGVSAAR